MRTANKSTQAGIAMMEILITMVILAVGLLALAGLQSRLQVSQTESYQRSQAAIILKDMVSRVENNRNKASEYVTAVPLGFGAPCSADKTTTSKLDSAEICESLQGASEVTNGNNAGAMVGGRGCIQNIGDKEYLLTVAWQGLIPIAAPPKSVSCGINLYNNGSARCINDLCRRTITTVVKIAEIE